MYVYLWQRFPVFVMEDHRIINHESWSFLGCLLVWNSSDFSRVEQYVVLTNFFNLTMYLWPVWVWMSINCLGGVEDVMFYQQALALYGSCCDELCTCDSHIQKLIYSNNIFGIFNQHTHAYIYIYILLIYTYTYLYTYICIYTSKCVRFGISPWLVSPSRQPSGFSLCSYQGWTWWDTVDQRKHSSFGGRFFCLWGILLLGCRNSLWNTWEYWKPDNRNKRLWLYCGRDVCGYKLDYKMYYMTISWFIAFVCISYKPSWTMDIYIYVYK